MRYSFFLSFLVCRDNDKWIITLFCVLLFIQIFLLDNIYYVLYVIYSDCSCCRNVRHAATLNALMTEVRTLG